MTITKFILGTTVAFGCLFPLTSRAQNPIQWTGGDGNFFDPTHWDSGTEPGVSDDAIINDGSTATIPADAGDKSLGRIELGNVEGGTESGHVIMNGGFLRLSETSGDAKAVIGLSGTLSTFIMNGGTIFFDGPDSAPGSSTPWINELDWEVGEKGMGRFEMHGDSVFRAGDDLKIAENALGNGSCLIDGNARLSVGSGISVSGGGASAEETMVIGGNAVVDSGNSMGAGSPDGGSEEGYLTMAFSGSTGKLTIQDNAVLNIKRLSAREGTSTIIVKDNGQFHIFDLSTGTGATNGTAGADRPEEVNANSTFVSASPGEGTFTLQDHAQMTVNSFQGLGISGRRDDNNTGGKATLIIRDNASLRIEQYLALGTGRNPDTSDGTLQVRGPNAVISFGGDFNMAVDPDGTISALDVDGNPSEIPGKSTLEAVITGAAHSTIDVGGVARIGQGILKVTLDGYTPSVGQTYTLIKGGTIEGEFRTNDFSGAALPAGLAWKVNYTADSVQLAVVEKGAGRIVTVTTANNTTPPAGSVSLLQALQDLQDGDHIRFNIPGTNPIFITTPDGGYPLITKNDVTIDGYSQPGSVANTNSILSANSAKIGIVLDSRSGNTTLMDFPGDSEFDQTGYGDTESAVLGVLQATNVTISGLSILAVPVTGSSGDISVYDISFAKGASGRISGCWLGIAPDGNTVASGADAVTGFRYRIRDENNTVLEDILVNNVIIGVEPGARGNVGQLSQAEARAEFNVIVGAPAIPIIIEGNNTRISGNFVNVFPDGMRDFNPPLADPQYQGVFEGNIEIGRGGNNSVIGVDGDGINDAEERNIFSGVIPENTLAGEYLGGYDHNVEFYGQNPGTNVVVAGNYFGVAVDGTTRFTNGVPALNAAGGSAQYRFGSDGDGVSDALEGNLVANNWPESLFPASALTDSAASLSFFDELSVGAIVSGRGNKLINNFPFPVSPLKGDGQFLIDYMAKALADSTAGVTPTLISTSTVSRISGSVPLGNEDFAVTILDLYTVDPLGISYGQAANIPEMTNGFVQGLVWLGSYVVDAAADLDNTPGNFAFDIAGLGLTNGTQLTVTANYSQAGAGTHNAVTLTSPFSDPVTVAGGTTGGGDTLTVRREGGNIIVTYTGTLQSAPTVVGPWTEPSGASGGSYTTAIPAGKDARFFRSFR